MIQDLDVTDARYGTILYPVHDRYVGRSFRDYREFSEHEVALFRQIVRPGDTVCDIGANIGAHTVALASLVGPTGAVFAFEPILTLYWLLCANVAINGLYRVRPVHAAISDVRGQINVPVIPYSAEINFGGLSLQAPLTGELVPTITLDELGLPPVAFMKIDVEHMEPHVLRGARALIARDLPVLYFEAHSIAEAEASMATLDGLGYAMAWHFAPLYHEANLAGNPHGFEETLVSRNVLAMPPGKEWPNDPYLVTKAQGDEALGSEVPDDA